jgi:hypothetical protein
MKENIEKRRNKMDKNEILNMSVGREMDALVAEKVMGICPHRNRGHLS